MLPHPVPSPKARATSSFPTHFPAWAADPDLNAEGTWPRQREPRPHRRAGVPRDEAERGRHRCPLGSPRAGTFRGCLSRSHAPPPDRGRASSPSSLCCRETVKWVRFKVQKLGAVSREGGLGRRGARLAMRLVWSDLRGLRCRQWSNPRSQLTLRARALPEKNLDVFPAFDEACCHRSNANVLPLEGPSGCWWW